MPPASTQKPAASVSSWLQPALNCANAMRFSQKFSWISVLFAAPIFLASSLLIINTNKDLTTIANEQHGNNYNRPLAQVVGHLVGYRQAVLLNNTGRAASEAQAVDQALTQVSDFQNQYGETLSTADNWGAFKKAWDQAKAAPSTDNASNSVTQALSLMTYVGDKSGLILDPQLDSYYLMDSLVLRFPQLADDLGQALSLAKDWKSQLSDATRTALIQRLTLAQEKLDTSKANLDVVYRETANTDAMKALLNGSVNDYAATTSQYLDALRAGIESGQFDTDALAASLSTCLSHIDSVYGSHAKALGNLLELRKQAAPSMAYWGCAGLLVLSLAYAYFITGFSVSVKRSVQQFQQASNELVNGHLNVQLVLDSKDELGDVCQDFNRVAKGFSTIMQDIGQKTLSVNSSSSSLSGISNEMANAIQEMSTALNLISKNAAEAPEVVDHTKSTIDAAQGTFERFKVTTRKIGEIVNSLKTFQDKPICWP